MDTAKLSLGTQNRLKRIMEIKGFTEERALEYAIAVGWTAAEQQNTSKSRKKS